MRKLPAAFFNRHTIDVAIDLLGCRLVSNVDGVKTGGIIVETEAYIGETDPACHAFRGKTNRNRVMYGPPGFLYVYFTYGNHFMANVVAEKHGFPAAVLLRGLDPLYNIDVMAERRSTEDFANIASGPGKLTKALGMTTEHNGTDLTGRQIFIQGPATNRIYKMASPRIGIGENGSEKLWRFFIRNNPHVSRGSNFNRSYSFSLSRARKMRFAIKTNKGIH
jgi:DNA-3-methyladenine glycosylase